MVKMETTEPSVILKLKKGGHVAGHSAMKSTMSMDAADGKFAPPGKAPKKPSIMDRRKSMKAPMLMSKDGGVAKKAMGGMMGAPMGAPAGAGAMMSPAMKKALMMRMMAQRGAGRSGMAAPAPMAAPMGPAMKKGGKAGDTGQDKAMIKKAFKQHDAQEHMGGKGTELKLRKGGTTKVVDGDKTDKAHGTGAVKMGKPGGYATGGVAMSNAGGYKKGGSADWENRPANSAKPGKTNTTTGEVKESNAGGYKKGGAAKKHFATGGSVNNAGHAVAMPRKPVSKPVANTMQSGTFAKGGSVEKEEKPNLRLLKTHTGPKGHVAKVYKDKDWGEHRVKFFSPEGKHYSQADYHTDDAEDAHGTAQGQLNRYKSGGKVVHKAGGGGMPLKGHEYHGKSDAELKYILKDAGEAARAMKDHSPKSESKYLDQVNDAATVLHYRKNGITRKADGGSMPTADDGYDPIVEREARRRTNEQEATRRENEATPVMDSVKRLLGIRPNAGAGRGFVNPTMTRKTGGRAC